jgi:phage protein D/phage baseplate assembly protein gpV
MPALTQQVLVKVNGTALAESVRNALVAVEVESSIYLPDMFSMTLVDDKDLTLTNGTTFALGAAVVISFGDATNALVEVFNGEITAVEPEFAADAKVRLTIRGYDKRHRLNRGTKTKAYLNMKASDIANQIAGAAGLTASVTATTVVYPHIIQHNQTDLAFLRQLAYTYGFEVTVRGSNLYFGPQSGSRGTVTLQWLKELRSFRPRLSLAQQVNEVKVKGWDPKTKLAILGTATTSTAHPSVGTGGSGGALAQTAFSSTASQVVVRRPVISQSEATKLAQAILDEINAGSLEADGVAIGNPNLLAGKKVTLQKLGSKFSGSYLITSARHTYLTGELYETEFSVTGATPELFSSLVESGDSAGESTTGRTLWSGVVPAVVSNSKDPENRARVKVKFPWLDDQVESNWARVCAVGAGANRGLQWIPEVNDEVLIAFEHGDFDYPYVVGSIWNGKDAAPNNPQVDQNGKVEIRMLKTRAGHLVRFNDKQGEQKIEIIDAQQNTTLTMDTQNKKITIKSKGEIEVNSDTNITVKAAQNINLEATGTMTIKGANVNVEATTGNFSQKAMGTGTVQSTGPMTIKGAVVNIN